MVVATLSFEDAVTAGNLNRTQKHAVYYGDGLFANRSAVAAQCPDAALFGITVHGLTGPAFPICDCEKGDLTTAQAIAWVEEQIALRVALIVVYANLSTWEGGLQTALAKHGTRIKRWVAHYDNIAKVPAGFDIKQYATGSVDRNIGLATCFTPILPKPDVPHGKVRFEGTYDIATEKLESVHGLPGVGVHFTGPEKWLDVGIQVSVGKTAGGRWRAKP